MVKVSQGDDSSARNDFIATQKQHLGKIIDYFDFLDNFGNANDYDWDAPVYDTLDNYDDMTQLMAANYDYFPDYYAYDNAKQLAYAFDTGQWDDLYAAANTTYESYCRDCGAFFKQDPKKKSKKQVRFVKKPTVKTVSKETVLVEEVDSKKNVKRVGLPGHGKNKKRLVNESVHPNSPKPLEPVSNCKTRLLRVFVRSDKFSGNAFCVGNKVYTAAHVLHQGKGIVKNEKGVATSVDWSVDEDADLASASKNNITGVHSYKAAIPDSGVFNVFACYYDEGKDSPVYIAGTAHVDPTSPRHLLHTCTTTNGNSGCPIVDAKSGFVLAIHQQGMGKRSFNTAYIPKDWTNPVFVASHPSKGGLAI